MKAFTGTKHYDYIFTDHLYNLRELMELLQRHNGKRIILDAAAQPKILSLKGCIQVLEQVTESPAQLNGSEKEKTGNLDASAPLHFIGQIVLLVNSSKKQLNGDKRFAKLLRQFNVI